MQAPVPAGFSVSEMLSCLEALPPGFNSPGRSGSAERALFTQCPMTQKLTAICYPQSNWYHRGMNTVSQAASGFFTLALQCVELLS